MTRATQQAGSFVTRLSAKGAEALCVPALTIEAPSDWSYLDTELHRLNEYKWLILTSANGVDFFVRRLLTIGYELSILSQVKIAVVGRKTAMRLDSYGISADFVPPSFVSESLIEHFPGKEEMAGAKILYPCLEKDRRELLISELSKLGAVVVDVPAYRSSCPPSLPSAVIAMLKQHIDVVTFASPKTVRYFYQLVSQSEAALKAKPDELFSKTAIASIGPFTSKTCQAVFGRVDIQPEEYSLIGLENAIIQWALSR